MVEGDGGEGGGGSGDEGGDFGVRREVNGDNEGIEVMSDDKFGKLDRGGVVGDATRGVEDEGWLHVFEFGGWM